MTVPSSPADPGGPSFRRARWGLFLPTLLLLALAAVWSGFWFYAAGKADEAIDAWLSREAEHGRVYACEGRHLGGFPFRVKLTCENPTARLPADGGPVVASAPRFLAVAQVYDPSRLIGELSGPVEITAAAGRKASLSFALAEASIGMDGRRFDRASVSLTAPRLVVDDAEVGAGKAMQVHVRRAGGAEGVYDLAARLDDAVAPAFALLPVGAGPASFEVQAEIRGIDDFNPKPTSERLRAFAEAGGRVHVALARIARGDVAANATGDFGLDPEGRIDAGFDVTARGVDGVVQSLVGGGKKTAWSALVGVGAAMLGAPARLDDQPATTYRVTIDRGKVAVGPIKLTRLPPVF